MNKMLKLLVALIAICFLFTACQNDTNESTEHESNHTTTESASGLIIPEATDIGGYVIESEQIYCKVFVKGDTKYLYYKSNTANRTIEYYSSPTETIAIDTQDGKSKCYQSSGDAPQKYTNPLVRIYDDLRGKDIVVEEAVELNGIGYDVYSITENIELINQKQIPYIASTITIDWKNDKTYTFKYYDYSDSAVLISAEAPAELNPMLTPNTTWQFNMDESFVYNTESDEKILFTIEGMVTGYGLSPKADPDATVEVIEYVTYIYTNPNNGAIERVGYAKNGVITSANIQLIHNMDVTKPTVTENMLQMTPDELQNLLMTIYMLETIV